MRAGKSIWHWVSLVGTSVATAGWAWLFYANYWNADIVAFGDAAVQLAALKVVFWQYVATGGALLAVWAYNLWPGSQKETAQSVQRVQVRGH